MILFDYGKVLEINEMAKYRFKDNNSKCIVPEKGFISVISKCNVF